MTDKKTPSKRAAWISLDDDLVREARLYTPDLGNTLEWFRGEFIARKQSRRGGDDAALARIIQSLDAFHAEHGLLSDEFSGL